MRRWLSVIINSALHFKYLRLHCLQHTQRQRAVLKVYTSVSLFVAATISAVRVMQLWMLYACKSQRRM